MKTSWLYNFLPGISVLIHHIHLPGCQRVFFLSYLIPDSSPRRHDCKAQSAKKKLSRKLYQTVNTVYFILGTSRRTSGDMAHIQTFETPREPRIVRRNDTVHDATTKRYMYMLIPVKTSLNIRKQINGKKCPDIFYLVGNQVANPSTTITTVFLTLKKGHTPETSIF